MIQNPPMANLFLAMRARASFQREEPCGTVEVWSLIFLVGISGLPDPGIQQAGEQVGEEVHDYDKEAKKQR